jgi:hypothetical protein
MLFIGLLKTNVFTAQSVAMHDIARHKEARLFMLLAVSTQVERWGTDTARTPPALRAMRQPGFQAIMVRQRLSFTPS